MKKPLVPAGGWMIAPPATVDFKTMGVSEQPVALGLDVFEVCAGIDQDRVATFGVEYALGDGLPRGGGARARWRVQVVAGRGIHIVGEAQGHPPGVARSARPNPKTASIRSIRIF